MTKTWIIGGGPAGLMAAERIAQAGHQVVIADHKPSLARKFLMAGKSGLNLTMDEPATDFQSRYFEGGDWLAPMLQKFGPPDVKAFATGLEQQIFVGSTGRVFPNAMKASPLLRAWLRRLSALGVETRTRWRWTGWTGDQLTFDTPDGPVTTPAEATVLALGGGSWARLGSDGSWMDVLNAEGIETRAFKPSNSAVTLPWSTHMAVHFGTPVKSISLSVGGFVSRGEVVLSQSGLEGGGVYAITPGLREGHRVILDLLPDLTAKEIVARLARAKPGDSVSNKLRKALRLPKVKQAILQEFARPLPADPQDLAAVIKALPLTGAALAEIDGAISTAGGVPREAVGDDLMLRAKPGVFVAGEMLDWDAPTGGYLVTACLSTGAWAGDAAVTWLQASRKS